MDIADSEEHDMLSKLAYKMSEDISADLRLQMQAEILMGELSSNSLQY